ncbi:MAG: hypothetical protein ACRDZ8_13680 [Acidimicrobiales bacterium]
MSANAFKAANRTRLAGITLLVVAMALIAACGASTKHTTSATTTSTTSKSPSTAGDGGSTATSATSTKVAPTTTTTPAGPSFATVSGTYNSGTADGGWLYIRSDGASRLRLPDGVACPECPTADSPIADIDFSLTSLSSTGPGAYRASGTVMGTSDPTLAKMLSAAATIGSPISLTISGGNLTLSVLLSSDTLTLGSKQAPPSTASPCTVGAVSAPIAAANPSQTVHIAGVSCSSDGEWAAASVSLGQGQGAIDTVSVLAGSGGPWVLADRPTVCNNHDVTPSFDSTACSTS